MLRRNSTILWRELGGEAVLLNPEIGCSYNLNAVGTLIWKLLDGHHSTESIAKTICEHYEVTHEQAVQDIERIIDELRQNNLLHLSTSLPSSVGQ
ncbi:MAG: hypothetical protein NVS4B12_03390 [Ktedonobacteraceae bacterium]